MAPRHSNGWLHNLCSCTDLSACCGVVFCGACMFGKTNHRLRHFPTPPEKSSFSWFNSSCALMFCATCLLVPWVPVCMQRQEMREKFDLEGNGCVDCLATCFCTCCAQIQQDNEVRQRAIDYVPRDSNRYDNRPARMLYEPQAENVPAEAPPAYNTKSKR